MIVFRVALTGKNALIETNPDNYAVLSDNDNIIIKEKIRGQVDIAASSSKAIPYGLSYIPFVKVFADIGTNQWIEVRGDAASFNVNLYLTNYELVLVNNTGSAVTFKYFIYYDQQNL